MARNEVQIDPVAEINYARIAGLEDKASGHLRKRRHFLLTDPERAARYAELHRRRIKQAHVLTEQVDEIAETQKRHGIRPVGLGVVRAILESYGESPKPVHTSEPIATNGQVQDGRVDAGRPALSGESQVVASLAEVTREPQPEGSVEDLTIGARLTASLRKTGITPQRVAKLGSESFLSFTPDINPSHNDFDSVVRAAYRDDASAMEPENQKATVDSSRVAINALAHYRFLPEEALKNLGLEAEEIEVVRKIRQHEIIGKFPEPHLASFGRRAAEYKNIEAIVATLGLTDTLSRLRAEAILTPYDSYIAQAGDGKEVPAQEPQGAKESIKRKKFELTGKEFTTLLAYLEPNTEGTGQKNDGRKIVIIVFGSDDNFNSRRAGISSFKNAGTGKIRDSIILHAETGKPFPQTHLRLLEEVQTRYPKVFGTATLEKLIQVIEGKLSIGGLTRRETPAGVKAKPRVKVKHNGEKRVLTPSPELAPIQLRTIETLIRMVIEEGWQENMLREVALKVYADQIPDAVTMKDFHREEIIGNKIDVIRRERIRATKKLEAAMEDLRAGKQLAASVRKLLSGFRQQLGVTEISDAQLLTNLIDFVYKKKTVSDIQKVDELLKPSPIRQNGESRENETVGSQDRREGDKRNPTDLAEDEERAFYALLGLNSEGSGPAYQETEEAFGAACRDILEGISDSMQRRIMTEFHRKGFIPAFRRAIQKVDGARRRGAQPDQPYLALALGWMEEQTLEGQKIYAARESHVIKRIGEKEVDPRHYLKNERHGRTYSNSRGSVAGSKEF